MRSNFLKPLPAPRPALLAGVLLACSISLTLADELSDAQRLMKQGKSAAALEKVDAYLANQPKDAQGRFLKGLILVDIGRTSEAFAVFSKLNEDYPELPEPYNNLAVLYAQQQQYERARTALEMAIRTDPSYAIARDNLGDVYARLASESYQQALQLDPSSKATKSKLAKLGELSLASSTSGSRQAAATRPAGETSKTTSTEPAKPAVTAPAVAAATSPAVKPASKPAPAAAPTVQAGEPVQENRVAIAETASIAPVSSGDIAPVVTEEARGVAGKSWDLVFSPYTYHYNYSPDHKPVVLLGLTKGLEGRWLVGGVAFSNSFGQPSAYIFGGQRYVSPFGFENWYLQWTAGLLYGYVGKYQDNVPYNYNGFSPGFVPSIGYQFKRVYAELDVLGNSALMFSLVFPLPRDWP